jgi:hypothetical protein
MKDTGSEAAAAAAIRSSAWSDVRVCSCACCVFVLQGANAIDCAATDGATVYLSSNNGTNGAPLIYKSEQGGAWVSVFGSTGNINIAIGYEGDGGYAPLTGGFGWSW